MPLILNRISKILLLHFEIITVKEVVSSDFWTISVRINCINRQIRPKNQKIVVWGAKIFALVVWGTIKKR
jgi:hypothetical protein